MADVKAFNVRLSKELWRTLKKTSMYKEESMNELIINALEIYLKKYEKRVDVK